MRGKVIPIISMHKRFGLPDAEQTNRFRIMVMEVAGVLRGFIVDGGSEVIRITSGEIQPPPVVSGNIGQEYFTGVFNHAERLLITLDTGQAVFP